ncbi:MAG: hypothetical protein LBF01_02850 [Bacteroidales bacterium]|nr:hypothetical protein [Bacteroidales bacterium]
MKIFCLAVILFLQSSSWQVNAQSKGNIYFRENIEELLKKNREYNISQKIQGFKILIFSQTGNGSKSNAFSAKNDFLELFPNIPTYLIYEEPYFKVKAGNFKTKREALEFLRIVQDVYPNVFIVQDVLDIDDYFSDNLD